MVFVWISPAPGCRHHVGLWRAYVHFCCRRDSHHRDVRPAVDVFYRALRRCPWAKPVFLEAFAPPLVGALDAAALRAVYATLADKGLRVHVDLDDFVARWKAAAKPEASSHADHQHHPASGRR